MSSEKTYSKPPIISEATALQSEQLRPYAYNA